MEKYSKPVMVLEEIEDEVYTIDAAALPNNPNQVIFVSGETTTVTVPDTSPVPAEVPSGRRRRLQRPDPQQ